MDPSKILEYIEKLSLLSELFNQTIEKATKVNSVKVEELSPQILEIETRIEYLCELLNTYLTASKAMLISMNNTLDELKVSSEALYVLLPK